MLNFYTCDDLNKKIVIVPICQDDFMVWKKNQSLKTNNFMRSNNFLAEPSTYCILTDEKGDIEKILLGIKDKNDFLSFGVLPIKLPEGTYLIDSQGFSKNQLANAAIGWGLGNYNFGKYKSTNNSAAKLMYNKDSYDIAKIKSIVSATFLVRDLINTPANDLYPEKLGDITSLLSNKFNAKTKIIKGEQLNSAFPAVYSVGKASKNDPVLIDLTYGDRNSKKIVLVGKGVCFDSGGLQLKSPTGMSTMKKDMGGAAHALGIAQMIMELNLPLNLRVIIPAVENMIAGNSLKPGDIIKTRNGTTVEIENTDAEGRLILADALTYASEWKPEFIFDFATLTGAARIALGPDISALFSNNDKLAEEIINSSNNEQETLCRLPLFQSYLELLKSKIANLRNIAKPDIVGAGAIIAALFLQQFVDKNIAWAHFDIDAYNNSSKPGKPEGGEACCIRGVFDFLKKCCKN